MCDEFKNGSPILGILG